MRRRDILLAMAGLTLTGTGAGAQAVEYDLYDREAFQRLIAGNKPVVVHVSTTW